MTQCDNAGEWANGLLQQSPKGLNRCGGGACGKLDYHQALAHVAMNLDQFAIHRRGVDGKVGERIDSIVVLHAGDKVSFAIVPMLFGHRGPHATAEVFADARGNLYAHAPGFKMRRWIVACHALKCWRVWIEELDGPADPLETAP